jgi:secondary thiamine-phosphate synthase enzyme
LKVQTTEIRVQTQHRLEFVDLTDDLLAAVKNSGVVDGAALAFCAHTTCSLMVNEWEEGVLEDLRGRLDKIIPEGGYFAHDDFNRRTQNLIEDERANGRSHVVQIVLGGSSQTIPIRGGEVLFGRWQRLILLELDEPKARTVVFQVSGV